MKRSTTASPSPLAQRRYLAAIEVALIVALLFVFAGSPPPGDDEAHYLGKAKQYWNPEWLAGDFFLETPDAHVVFNWAIGWLTLFFSLDATAWITRFAAWLLLAVAWQRLSYAIVPRPFVSLLTMALFLVLQQYGSGAREWIVGGVEAKCFAWAFVVFALEQIVRAEGFGVQGSGFRKDNESDAMAANPTGRGEWNWNIVWLLLGIASALHVLVGGWAVVAAMLTWLATKHRPSFMSMLPALVAGGTIALFGLVPALRLSAGVDPQVTHDAHHIYVFERLNHHLVIHDFPWRYRWQFLGALSGWLVVAWLTRNSTRSAPLRKFVLASLVIGICGIAIDQATLHHPDLAASLLRYYWYRLPDMAVPIGLALGLAELWSMRAEHAPDVTHKRAPAWPQFFLIALCIVPMVVFGWRAAVRLADRRSGSDVQSQIPLDDVAAYRQACRWINSQTPESSRFLTPPLYQSFRWHAQRSEVASWKDIPQSARDVVEWRDRTHSIRRWWRSLEQRGYTPAVERRLHELAEKYDVQYVLVPRSLTSRPLGLTPLFSNATSSDDSVARGYTVYWIGPNDRASR